MLNSLRLSLTTYNLHHGAIKRAPPGTQSHEDCEVHLPNQSPSIEALLTVPRSGLDKVNAIIRSRLAASTATATNATLEPIRIYAQSQSTHPLAHLPQSSSQQNRWFSNSARNLSFASRTAERASFPVSKTSRAVAQSGAAPFASTLRPNLTGGALPRTAGGYCLGGSGRQGVRHFSHTPSAQAQVVQNVSAGIRAFIVGGGKVRYDGVDARTGAKKYKAVTKTQDKVLEKLSEPVCYLGSSLEFRLSPTITALGPSFPSTSSSTLTLGNSGVLDTLSTDFARALRDLSLILADLRRLASLGDLPLTLTPSLRGPILAVRFPGCDSETVESLCDEIGVRRGFVREDEGWQGDKAAEMALLFPFASTEDGMSEVGDEYFEHRKPEQLDWQHMLSPAAKRSMPSRSSISTAMTFTDVEHVQATPLDSEEGYESLGNSSEGLGYCDAVEPVDRRHPRGSEDYEGLEGIYRFLRECDEARR